MYLRRIVLPFPPGYEGKIMTGAMKIEEERELAEEKGREALSKEMAVAVLQAHEPSDKIVKYTLLSIDRVKGLGNLHSLL